MGYGYVNVISPVGLPIRGIVGISPDPTMFVAINTEDMEKSRAFYEQLGMVEQKIPVVSNPVVRSLNIVYNPNDNSDESPVSEVLSTADPSSVGIAFSSVGAFEKEMKAFSSA